MRLKIAILSILFEHRRKIIDDDKGYVMGQFVTETIIQSPTMKAAAHNLKSHEDAYKINWNDPKTIEFFRNQYRYSVMASLCQLGLKGFVQTTKIENVLKFKQNGVFFDPKEIKKGETVYRITEAGKRFLEANVS